MPIKARIFDPPGAGTYEKDETWGKEGQKRSFGSRLKYEPTLHARKALLPGPGQYVHEDVFSSVNNSKRRSPVG